MTATAKTNEGELRGTPLEVFAALLAAGKHEELLALFAELAKRNEALELRLAKLLQSKHSNERISADQLALFLDAVKAAEAPVAVEAANDDLAAATTSPDTAEPEATKPPRQPPRRRAIPPELPRVPNPLRVPDAERPCPKCGAERQCLTHENTEVIDIIPAQVIVRVDMREILTCKPCDGEVERAAMGDKVVTGGRYGSGLVAELMTNKYWFGIPLYRQAEMLSRMGLDMPSASMSDQICWGTDLLRPIWVRLRRLALESDVLHVDATGMPVRDKDHGHAVQLGSMWGFVGTGETEVAVYLYTSTGAGKGKRPGEVGPLDYMNDRKGPIVADAAGLFDALFTSGERLEVGCNMHARRYFKKALDAGDARAAMALKAFQILYDVEAAVRGESEEVVLAARQARSREVYDELLKWQRVHSAHEPPKSLFGVALKYLSNHADALMRFLDDGRLPIDNGVVERLHRRVAVGRKNYLFAGSHAGGERAAIAYSVLGTCALLGVNANVYLRDVLPVLARGGLNAADIDALLPDAWLAARAPV